MIKVCALTGWLVVLALSACGSEKNGGGTSSSASAASTPPSSTAPVSSSAAPSTTVVTSTTPATSAPPVTLPACTTPQTMIASSQRSTQSGDTSGLLLILTNAGQTACTISGYPSVAAITAAEDPAVLARKVPRSDVWGGLKPNTTTPPTFTLDPGARASATVVWSASDFGSGKCVEADHVNVALPGGGNGATIAISTFQNSQWRPCGLSVTPIVLGATGTQ